MLADVDRAVAALLESERQAATHGAGALWPVSAVAGEVARRTLAALGISTRECTGTLRRLREVYFLKHAK